MHKKDISNNEEGENMLAKRKDTIGKNEEVNYTPAKKEDVVKAIMKSNKKHKKMMTLLSK